MAEKSRDKEIYERLTRIETDLGHIDKAEAERDEKLAEIDSKLDTLSLELSRYRGTVGGVLLVVTALVTFFKLFGTSILEYFQK
jgi:hypothetical protein